MSWRFRPLSEKEQHVQETTATLLVPLQLEQRPLTKIRNRSQASLNSITAADEVAVPRLNQHRAALNCHTLNHIQDAATCQSCFSFGTYIRNALLGQGEA